MSKRKKIIFISLIVLAYTFIVFHIFLIFNKPNNELKIPTVNNQSMIDSLKIISYREEKRIKDFFVSKTDSLDKIVDSLEVSIAGIKSKRQSITIKYEQSISRLNSVSTDSLKQIALSN